MNNTSSIEFQTIKDELQQSDAVRKAFRVPVESRDDIKVVLNDETYLVVDISISGVSIVSKENPTLVVSKTYQNCPFWVSLFQGSIWGDMFPSWAALFSEHGAGDAAKRV